MATVSQPTSTQQPAQEIITTENMETPLLENDGVHTESNSSLPQQTPQVNSNIGHEQLSSGNKAQEQEQETRAIYKTNIYVFLPLDIYSKFPLKFYNPTVEGPKM